jgi:hypothetical protein
MGVRRRFLLSAFITATVVACTVGSYSPLPEENQPPAGPGGGNGNNGGTDAGGVSGDLPCAVADLLVAHCTQCHGSVPANGAPSSLNSLAALRAPSVSQPSKSNGQVALERMSSSTARMPPAPNGQVSSTELSDFAAWVSAGMAAGTCGAPGPDGGGGLPPDAGGGLSQLPCDIADMLGTYCTLCHGTPPRNGAPVSLDSLPELRAPSLSVPSESNGQLAVTRMGSSTAPMPPAPYGRVPAATQNLFAAWVSGGMGGGTCTVPDAGSGPPVGGTDGGRPDAGGGGPPSDAGVSGDLPCNVAGVLVGHCTLCHGSPPSNGAPMSLNSLGAMHAPSPSQPSKTNGQRSVERMADTVAPMPPPPNPAVPGSEQSIVADWVSAGMPAGSCGAPSPDGGVDAGPDPIFGGPPTCTSGTYWRGGEGSSLMHPGLACISCHSRGEGPRFAIAGTIYPTGHEYDDCNGTAASGAVVQITDNAGVTRSFTANSAGNFYGSASGGWPTFPIRARVTFQGRTRSMSGAVPSGDCNSCHTLNGANGAPGRVALP